MIEFLTSIDYWHWWILAGILLLIELAAPSFFFLWLAVAGAIVGLALLVQPELPWELQLALFSLISVSSIVAFRAYQNRHPAHTDQPALNRRGEQYIGRVFTLADAIVNGYGTLNIDDTTWRIHGTDAPAGTRVTVTGVEGTILTVEFAD